MNLSDRCEAELGPTWTLLIRLGQLAAERGERAVLVGGVPRDLILGVSISGDMDLLVEGDAIALAEAWTDTEGGSLVRHRPFNNAIWKSEQNHFDFVRARTEHYPAVAALPEVSASTIEDDLQRRDFRINAMAIDLHPDRLGHLIDPHLGQKDLQERRLEVFHEASFTDDPTRAIRAVRYVTRLDLEIGESCLMAIDHAQINQAFEALSLERFGAEIHRMLQERDAGRCLECATGLGVLDRLPIESFSLYTSAEDCLHVHQTWTSEAIDQAELLWMLFSDQFEEPEQWVRLVPGGGIPAKRFARGTGPIREALFACEKSEDPADHGQALQPLDAIQRAFAHFLAPGHPALHWWEQTGRTIGSTVTSEHLKARGLLPGPQMGTALALAQRAAWRGAPHHEQLSAALP